MAERNSGTFVDATQYNEDTFDIGDVKASARRTASNGWLGPIIGQAVSRTTYADLFAAIVPDLGVVTVTIASPGVFTLASHGLVVGDRVYLTTSGALPTGLAANTIYYVVSTPTSGTFTLSATEGGSAINTTGSQSGTHHVWACPYGLGDGSTTFNVPDSGARALVGASGSGGHADIRAAGQSEGVALANRRPKHRTSNALTHNLTLPSHGHGLELDAGGAPGTGITKPQRSDNAGTVSSSTPTDAPTSFPAITGSITGSIGTNVATDPLDTAPYLGVYVYIKYA